MSEVDEKRVIREWLTRAVVYMGAGRAPLVKALGEARADRVIAVFESRGWVVFDGFGRWRRGPEFMEATAALRARKLKKARAKTGKSEASRDLGKNRKNSSKDA